MQTTHVSQITAFKACSLDKVRAASTPIHSLTKLTVSHDLLHSTVTNQIAFDRQDSNMFPTFERTMDLCFARCRFPHWKPKMPSPLLDCTRSCTFANLRIIKRKLRQFYLPDEVISDYNIYYKQINGYEF